MTDPVRQPRVQTARQRLEAWLTAQALPPGTVLPPAHALARLLDVPHATLTRAEWQLICLGRLHRAGRKLFTGTAALSSLPPMVVFSALPTVQRAAREQAQQSGWECQVLSVGDITVQPGEFLRVLERDCAGVFIFVMPQPQAPLLQVLQRKALPCVIGGDLFPGFTCVAQDEERGVRQLVAHLVELGHQQLVYVASSGPDVHRLAGAHLTGYQLACTQYELPAAARRIVTLPASPPAAWDAAVQRLLRRRPPPTALVVETGSDAVALREALQRAGVRVPGQISVAALSSPSAWQPRAAGLTTLMVSDALQARLGMVLLQQLMWERHQHLRPSPPVHLRVPPTLMIRDSTAPPPGATRPRAVQAAPAPAYATLGSRGLLLPEDERRALVQQTRRANYPLTHTARMAAWWSLDLRAQVNRSVNRQNGWLGDEPLRHLPAAGPLLVHGVPFTLARERAGGSARALVLRSAEVRRGRQPLPATATFVLLRRVLAVYVLHGCGYAAVHQPFGAYQFSTAAGVVGTVPLLPLGRAGGSPAERARQTQAATIQDWWPDYPQFSHAQARHVAIAENDDPTRYERYLYTLEWRNPEPAIPLADMRVHLYGTEPATLGILAITLLLAPA